MPVRETVVTTLTEDRIGTQAWHGVTGRCQSMKTSEYHQALLQADQLYVRMVGLVDWKRILIIAAGRHAQVCAKKPPSSDYMDMMAEELGVCGECLHQAMLQLDATSHDWREDASKSRPDLEEEIRRWQADEEKNGWTRNMDFTPRPGRP